MNCSSTSKMGQITVRKFQPGDERTFREMNEAWIAPIFGIEERDRELLNDPVRYILDPGGHILMATLGDAPVGCCALVFMEDAEFELSKMTVDERFRGSGAGRRLLSCTIEYARELKARRLYLETNTVLVDAIHLYESLGFSRLPDAPSHSGYSRSNLRMELLLS